MYKKFYIVIFLSFLVIISEILNKTPLTPREAFKYEPNDNESILALGQQISISKIKQIELEMLPGISSVLANKIITERQKVVENKDFKIINGIGPKKSNQLKNYISLE